MTLTTLIINIGIVALILTGVIGVLLKQHKNWLMTFLQNFTGALFIFSGWVKAVDPLGTAFKMEQYFGEFQSTFQDTWMSFLAPLFPLLSEYAIGFSVFMIVFEIVLGIMLLMGTRPKPTSWAFLLLVGFFTFLTGFTYLTGYVPQDVNFFEFGKWGPYVESNMKVTDCGCFGDFLKLKPKVSFLKDIFLMIPALYFVFRHKDMHQLTSPKIRMGIAGFSTVAILVYCFSNYAWDLPHTDFRPFKEDANIAAIKAAEEEAAGNVQVTAYKLTSKADGKVIELPYDQFLKKFKDYPKEEWEYEQIKSEPTMESTKISDFSLTDVEGNEVTEDILSDPNYSFMIVCYKYYYETKPGTTILTDSIFTTDTIVNADTMYTTPRFVEVKQREVKENQYIFDKDYRQIFEQKINRLAEDAEKAGFKVYGAVGGAGEAIIDDFRHATQAAYPFYEADDILLKTIIRSNPGVVLWKNGTIVAKWHHKKLPSFDKIRAEQMK